MGEALGPRVRREDVRRRGQGAHAVDGARDRGGDERGPRRAQVVRRRDARAGAPRSWQRSPTRSATRRSGATTTRSTSRATRTSSTRCAPRSSRRTARAGEDRQAGRPQRVGHDAADGERLLQPVDERDGLPGRHPAAAVLQPGGGQAGQLRRHRHGHGPRADARLRRRGAAVRRQGQPARLVVAGPVGKEFDDARAVRGRSVQRLRRRRRPAPQRQADARARTSRTSAASSWRTRPTSRRAGAPSRRRSASGPTSSSSSSARRSRGAPSAGRRWRACA